MNKNKIIIRLDEEEINILENIVSISIYNQEHIKHKKYDLSKEGYFLLCRVYRLLMKAHALITIDRQYDWSD